ncbi:SDR family oxidoreductase [uncultured Nocardioides sp.]|uniref:SDR family NAD(P)-dependent oxidoreductase n=1 Tax=uncultured Nocardioides sp. TaxID=198441 RepID=UPI0026221FFE|nr:SDR family oxidoreductase [uncultured Nocardioides sp.]
MGRLQDKVVIVTGGESGIGLASARLFVAEGASVHLVGIEEGLLGEAVASLGEDHASATTADVTDEAAVERAVDACLERWGHLDVVFSNAGISGQIAPVAEQGSDGFARVLAVHVLGAFHVVKHTAPRIADGGSIIITSSIAGLIGFPTLSPYVAAKHAQVGLMRTVAKELAPRRVRVNTLHPGPTSTPFQDDIELRFTGEELEAANKFFDDLIPLGRHSTVDEIARAALYLASDDSAMVTSVTFSIDGGLAG